MDSVVDEVKVLLIEDDEDDYLITRETLASQSRVRFRVQWAADYDSGLAAIGGRTHDVYLIDYRLGARTGLELVQEAFSSRPRAPVIMLTGETDYEIDLEATSLGVTDFLVKQDLTPAALERSIRYAIRHHRANQDLALSEERYALAVRGASDGIWDWDLVGDRTYFSPRWSALLGQTERAEPASPAAWFGLVHPDDLNQLHASIDAHLAGKTPHLQTEHRMRHADGSWRWMLTRGVAIHDAEGVATRMAGSMSDITDRRDAELKLEHDAMHDGLTGLPNRALFMDRVDQVLQRARRDATSGGAVLFLDIDRFKLVNDSLSHAVGDQLLVALAGRISAALRPGDTVARIGGDEFTLLLEGVRTEPEAAVIGDRVRTALGKPFSINGHQLFLTVSIGISLSAPDMDAADLLRNADIAMYAAKGRGRAGWAAFDESMRRRVVQRLERENELREAIERSLLEVHYQPIVDLATGRLRAFEALARWPSGWTPVAPAEFIPIAEETGLIGPLGSHVMQRALQALAAWRRRGLVADYVCLNVNVSGLQLEDPRLPDQVRSALADSGLPPEALRLEITESALMQEHEVIAETIAEVCESGVGLHLDDFGTGYSSLATLHRCPVGALKIDRSFVASLKGGAPENEVIISSTIALAHSFGLYVIAEGIEDMVQLRRLRTLGCEYGQGFLFSRPVSEEAIPALLANWSPSSIALLADRVEIE